MREDAGAAVVAALEHGEEAVGGVEVVEEVVRRRTRRNAAGGADAQLEAEEPAERGGAGTAIYVDPPFFSSH
jgi:hypothetical protein